MHAKIFIPLLITTTLTFVGCAQHADWHDMHDHMMMNHDDMASKPVDTTGAIDLRNAICPVTGDKIEDSKNIAVYQGKIYHFCCSDCPKDFAKDPGKYAKMVAADPAKFGVTNAK